MTAFSKYALDEYDFNGFADVKNVMVKFKTT